MSGKGVLQCQETLEPNNVYSSGAFLDSTPPFNADRRGSNIRRPVGPPPLLSLSGPVVGIDLGTVNSCVAFADGNDPKVLSDPGGYTTVPSVVHLSPDGEIMVGHAAREKMVLEPDRAVYGSKRFLGRPFTSQEVHRSAHFFNYALVQSPEGRVAAQVGDEVLTLEQVAGHILEHLKKVAQHHLKQEIQRAVITVPAYFGETQRQAVRDAGRLIGLHVERILNEPTAAAVAYGFGRGLQDTVLVYDLGGGTFDASVLRIDGDRVEVLASDGDPFLGGADFDDRLTEYVLMLFERKHRDSNATFREESVPMQRLRFAVERAKIQLSEANTAAVNLPYIMKGESGPLDLDAKIQRDVFEDLTEDLVDRTLGIVQNVLDRAKVQSSQLNEVILVGGQTRSPHVQRLLVNRFGRQPCKQVHADEAVALGAALVANTLFSDSTVDLVDVLPASIRVGLRDNKSAVLLTRGIRLPAEKRFDVPLNPSPQGETRVVLYRGEANNASDNTLLGTMRLPGTSHELESPKASVMLSISADGLLNIHALHPTLGDTGNLDVLLL